MAESLQQLILDHLDTHGSLSDSRNITIPGSTTPATDADAQISILGALNSLLSREVFGSTVAVISRAEPSFPADDSLRIPRDALSRPYP
jgi:hypothetical protein